MTPTSLVHQDQSQSDANKYYTTYLWKNDDLFIKVQEEKLKQA